VLRLPSRASSGRGKEGTWSGTDEMKEGDGDRGDRTGTAEGEAANNGASISLTRGGPASHCTSLFCGSGHRTRRPVADILTFRDFSREHGVYPVPTLYVSTGGASD